MAEEPLRAKQAADYLGIPTVQLLWLAYWRTIGFVTVSGVPHYRAEDLTEFERLHPAP
jgi:hypothetical protein